MTADIIPTFPKLPDVEEFGHVIFERIPNVFHASSFYWMTLRNPTIEIENYPISVERIENAKILIDEVEKDLRFAKKLRIVVLETDTPDDELSSLLETSNLMEEDEDIRDIKSNPCHISSFS